MSSIVDKAFNAAQKILRTVFRGSPNLFTTADLNRQVEALKYSIDSLESRVGFVSDISLSASISSGTLVVLGNLSYLLAKGCDFSAELSGSVTLSLKVTSGVHKYYVCLTGDTSLVTFSDDPNHNISGAKFQDGSSQAAADNYVVTNPALVLTTDTSAQNILGILAIIDITDTDNLWVKNNCISLQESLAVRESVMTRISPTGNKGGSLAVGLHLDEAICRINSIFFGRSDGLVRTPYQDWVTLTGPGNFSVLFSVGNGFMHFAIGEGDLTITGPASSVGLSTYLAEWTLPAQIRGMYIAPFIQSILSGRVSTAISNDSSGEGRFLRLVLMDTLAEGSFRAVGGHIGAPVVGRVKLVLGAKVNSNHEVDTVGVFLIAEKAGSFVQTAVSQIVADVDQEEEQVVKDVSLPTGEPLNVEYVNVLSARSSGVTLPAIWAPYEVANLTTIFERYYSAYDLGSVRVTMCHKETSIVALFPEIGN